MATAQLICTLALGKLGIVAAGDAPETADNDRTFLALQGMLQHYINSGALGSATDVILSGVTSYDANEFERVVHDGTVTVNLPSYVAQDIQTEQYGFTTYVLDANSIRPPMDTCFISVVRTDTGASNDYIYDNRLRVWTDVNALSLSSVVPLSTRDPEGFASCLAMRIAPDFSGNPVPDLVVKAAYNFEEALANNWSQSAQVTYNPDYM